MDRRAGREWLDLRPLRPLPGEPTAGVPAGLRRGHNLQWQALRYAVVHGYRPPLLSQGPARKERLWRSAEDLERAQADDQEGAGGVGRQVWIRLPGREVRGRSVRRL